MYNMKAALFDLDGVLINTEPVYTRIWSDIERHFPTGIKDFALVIKGSTLPAILNNYFKPSDHEAIITMLTEAEADMEYPLFPATVQFLKKLQENEIPAAIVTSSNDIKMQRLFAMYPGFKDYFRSVITDSRVKHGKPDPEGYLLGASDLKTAPADCVVFEDSFNGLKAGRAAGARVVGLATTNPAASLAEYADLVVSDLSDERLKILF